MLRATRAALRDTGLRVHDIEFVRLEPDTDVTQLNAFLDIGADLGAAEVICAMMASRRGRAGGSASGGTRRARPPPR